MFLLITISGCATIQPTIEKIQEEMVAFWGKIKGEKTEEHVGTREEALRRYGIEGLRQRLIVEPPIITPEVVKPGDKVRQEVQFALLAPEEGKRFKVSETVVFSSSKDTFELVRRSSEKAEGIHLSTIEFTLPADLDIGEYKLITTISIGKQKKTVSESFVLMKWTEKESMFYAVKFLKEPGSLGMVDKRFYDIQLQRRQQLAYLLQPF